MKVCVLRSLLAPCICILTSGGVGGGVCRCFRASFNEGLQNGDGTYDDGLSRGGVRGDDASSVKADVDWTLRTTRGVMGEALTLCGKGAGK